MISDFTCNRCEVSTNYETWTEVMLKSHRATSLLRSQRHTTFLKFIQSFTERSENVIKTGKSTSFTFPVGYRPLLVLLYGSAI